MKKQISFSSAKLKDLRKVVPLHAVVTNEVFDKWFNYDYQLSEEENQYLENLVNQNRQRLIMYSEEDLKVKFLGPLLNKVNFTFDEVTDWYERPISCEINGVWFSGITDYLVATGFDEPELPFFFIQEFKPSYSNSQPSNQLLAELLVAIHLTKETEMLGAYIVGRLWTFMLLRKEEETFHCYQSTGFNSIELEDLIAIYKTLQRVKADIKEKVEN